VYEWDETKREANLKKHGLDFYAAHLVYEDPKKITSRLKSKQEARFLDVALVEIKGAILALVLYYAQRKCAVHIIPICLPQGKETLCRFQNVI
jgi:hypothetical protein